MSERIVLTRWLEMRRGGQAGNQASPVITLEMMNGSGGEVNLGDVVVLQKTSAVGGTCQVETATVLCDTGDGITTAGNVTLTITADVLGGDSNVYSVAVLVGDSASVVANKCRETLNADSEITKYFVVGGTGANIILTSRYRFANDSTLNIATADDTSGGVTTAATSTNTTAGVAASGSTADLLAFTTTTTADNPDVYGVVYDASIMPGTIGRILRLGSVSSLKVDGTADIAIGDYISTFTTAKIGAKTFGSGAFAVALEAYTTNDSAGVIDAYVNCLVPGLGIASMGSSSSTAGSGITMSATRTAAFSVFSDDGNASIASSVLTRAGRFRNLQTYTSGNREQEAVGLIGQLVSVAGTNRHNMAGLMGSYEGSGALTVDGQASSTDPWAQAGVIGRVGVGSGVATLNANGKLAGLAAMCNTTSFLANNGVFTGVYVGRWSGAMDWGYGVYLENVDVGIQFAHTLTPDSTRSNRAIGIGSRATEIDVTMAAAATQHLDPIQVNMNIIGSNPSGSSTLNTFYALITHDTTDMSNMRLKNSDWNIVVGKDVLDVYCYQGEVDFNASGIAVGGEAAVLGLTLDAGANAVTGNLWGGIIVTQGAGLPAGSSAGLFLSHRGTGTLTHSLYIEANSGATITDAIYINPAGTITNALNIAALGGPASAYSSAGTAAYSIKCKINGVTTYIHTYDAA